MPATPVRQSARTPVRGLTTLELVVSLAIVAILLVATTPALHRISVEQRLRAAVAQFHSDLAFARSEAIHRTGEVISCPLDGDRCADKGEWQRGWQLFQDFNGDRELQDGEPVLRRAGPLEGVRILGSIHRNRLRFFPNGTAPGSNATLTFCDSRAPEAAHQISISASGRIRDKHAAQVDGDACT